MLQTSIVRQIVSYMPVADELQKEIRQIQENGNKIISIFETTVNGPDSKQGFIIIYDDGLDNLKLIEALKKMPIEENTDL